MVRIPDDPQAQRARLENERVYRWHLEQERRLAAFSNAAIVKLPRLGAPAKAPARPKSFWEDPKAIADVARFMKGR